MKLANEQQINNGAMRSLGSMQTSLISIEILRLEAALAALVKGEFDFADTHLRTVLNHMKGWTK